MKRFATLLIFSLAICTSQAVCVAAALGADIPTRVVNFADLNLSRQADADVLYRRIERAATNVCRPLDGRELLRSMRFRKCISAAVARAVADVRAPLLAEHYAALTQARAPSPKQTRLNR